jgi:hypothetical protein
MSVSTFYIVGNLGCSHPYEGEHTGYIGFMHVFTVVIKEVPSSFWEEVLVSHRIVNALWYKLYALFEGKSVNNSDSVLA